jgi:hypothetical protein
MWRHVGLHPLPLVDVDSLDDDFIATFLLSRDSDILTMVSCTIMHR